VTGEAGRLERLLVKRDSAGRTGKAPVGPKDFRVDILGLYRFSSKISSSPLVLVVERKRRKKIVAKIRSTKNVYLAVCGVIASFSN